MPDHEAALWTAELGPAYAGPVLQQPRATGDDRSASPRHMPQNGSPMSKATNIIVNRYTPAAGNYAASVSPESGGWTLFVPADGGIPDLWVEVDATDENGATVRGLVSIHDYPDPRHPTQARLPEDMTPAQIGAVGDLLCDAARDRVTDRAELSERHGYDFVAMLRRLGDYLTAIAGT